MGCHTLGRMEHQPHCRLTQGYFEERDCWLDCRGEDCLWISEKANVGWEVKLITLSHDISNPPSYGGLTQRRITIDDHAFIFFGAILYNCHIGEGAIVAAGSVVNGMKVEPYTMVAGNPAKVVRKYNFETKKWEKV